MTLEKCSKPNRKVSYEESKAAYVQVKVRGPHIFISADFDCSFLMRAWMPNQSGRWTCHISILLLLLFKLYISQDFIYTSKLRNILIYGNFLIHNNIIFLAIIHNNIGIQIISTKVSFVSLYSVLFCSRIC